MQMLPTKNCKGRKKKGEKKPSSGLQEFSTQRNGGFSLIRALVLVLFALSVKGLSNYAERETQTRQTKQKLSCWDDRSCCCAVFFFVY